MSRDWTPDREKEGKGGKARKTAVQRTSHSRPWRRWTQLREWKLPLICVGYVFTAGPETGGGRLCTFWLGNSARQCPTAFLPWLIIPSIDQEDNKAFRSPEAAGVWVYEEAGHKDRSRSWIPWSFSFRTCVILFLDSLYLVWISGMNISIPISVRWIASWDIVCRPICINVRSCSLLHPCTFMQGMM